MPHTGISQAILDIRFTLDAQRAKLSWNDSLEGVR